MIFGRLGLAIWWWRNNEQDGKQGLSESVPQNEDNINIPTQ